VFGGITDEIGQNGSHNDRGGPEAGVSCQSALERDPCCAWNNLVGASALKRNSLIVIKGQMSIVSK